jgi:hypothetical protein
MNKLRYGINTTVSPGSLLCFPGFVRLLLFECICCELNASDANCVFNIVVTSFKSCFSTTVYNMDTVSKLWHYVCSIVCAFH